MSKRNDSKKTYEVPGLNEVIENMPGYIYWKNINSEYMGCNKNMAQVSGLSDPSEIVGKTDENFKWGEKQASSFKQDDREVMQTGKVKITEHELPIKNSDGVNMHVKTEKIPLRNKAGEVIGVMGVAVEITELKETQEALKKANRSKMEFITTASHEIRNPISNVISLQNNLKEFLDKLQDIFYGEIFEELNKVKKSEIAQQVSEFLNKAVEHSYNANQEAKHSLDALENLGNLHRMQLIGVTTRWELNNIRNLLNEAVEKSTYPNQEKIDVQIDIDTAVPKEATIDYSNIRAALSIFIGNAIRFSDANSRIKIKVKNYESSHIIITVQDFGAGMSELQLKNLFSALLNDEGKARESIYRKPSVQLPQAKMKVEASGGILEIKSTPKQGTTVYVTIPYRLSESKDRMPEFVKEVPVKNFSQIPCCLLLIEDDPTIQKITSIELKHLGYRFDCVSNGVDAIKMALKNNYDVILLDISLPDINGLEVMRKVREKKQDESIFIAVTSHASEDDEDYFIGEGAMTVLKKPVGRQQLKSTIEAALKIKESLNKKY